MGGNQSTVKTTTCNQDLLCTVNQIAANYITSSSYQSMLHLTEQDKCNDLLTITTSALKKI